MTEDRRVVAISGAGTGIGQVTAITFAELGWDVVVGGRRIDKLEETRTLVEQAGGRCLPHALDVSDGESVETFFAAAEAELGTVTAVINNAATARYGPLEDFSPAEIELEVATKLVGSLLMARRGIIGMRGAGAEGDILFITSAAAGIAWPYHLPYASANAGIEHAARTLRVELEGSGIRVSTLRCGETVGTDFATNEVATGRMGEVHEQWFDKGIMRHAGVMTPDMVATAITTAVTLPRGVQYDLVVQPLAPVGPLPTTYEEYLTALIASVMPS